MKINYHNQDIKITTRNHTYGCPLCVLSSCVNLVWCSLLCRSGNIWIRDICNSDIFIL